MENISHKIIESAPARDSRLAMASLLVATVVPVILFFLIFAIADTHNSRMRFINNLFESAFLACGPLAFISGIVALIRIKRSGNQLKGILPAISGTIISAFLSFLIFSFISDAYAKEHHNYTSHCIINLKQVGLAMSMYSEDYDGRFPDMRHWNDAIRPYMKSPNAFICPSADEQTLPSYASNWRLSSYINEKLQRPSDTVVLFDSSPGRNLFGGLALAVYRHEGGCNFAFADGHVKSMQHEKAKELVWKP